MTAYEKVKAARDPARPTATDYINSIFTAFTEMHGDRRFSDDAAVVTGLALLGSMPVTVIGLEKGHDIKERVARNFGCAHPEGYRKALRQMKLAEKFRRPVVCFVDTAGAYCGIGAEERGQAQAIAERVKRECDCSHLDDVRVYTHNYGCSQLGDDHANTQRALAALVRHPNAGAVLVLGLGCENNQVSALKEVIGQWDDERVKFLVAQEVEDEIEAGFEICRGLVEKTKADKRQPLPLAYLKVGLKCGGSDGFSGITANPLVGLFSDWLIAQGGTTVLTEVPEMFGAETILMDRAADRRVFDGTVSLINDFKRYFRRFDQPIYENPSPGNKKGGITTLEEKSLGCVQKGGAQPVVDVLTYAQPVTKPGLNLLQAPGNDLVAASALALSGCQLVLFTTGRGTPFGSFVPTMKISTNTQLAEFKANWIDFNAGTLVEDEEPQAVLERFIGKVLATAGGERLKHEETGFKEIAIFKTGVTL